MEGSLAIFLLSFLLINFLFRLGVQIANAQPPKILIKTWLTTLQILIKKEEDKMKLLKLVKKIYKVEKELDILQNEAGELLKNLDAVEYENERLERTNKKKEEDLENYKKLADSMVRMADEESHKIVCTFGTATGTNGLTEEEKELLKKGIMEEIEKDVRMHAGMPRETEKLCARYKQSNFNSFYEGVLKKCANYWRTYFAEGKNAADAELEAEYKRQMEEGKALLENAKSNSIKDAMAVVTN